MSKTPDPNTESIETAAKDYSPSGLSSTAAKQKLQQFGPNAFAKEKLSAIKTFAKQLFNALNFILIFASALSFYLRDYTDALIILAIVLLNSILGFVQEYRSEKAVEKLSELLKHEALVIRDGKQILIDVADLVPGDTIILKGGDIVPADTKIMTAADLSVNESQLTGESVPIDKKPDDANSPKGLLYTGSVIERGDCQGVVYATGNHTQLGKIAQLSKDTKKTTPYQKSISEFSFSIMRIIGVTIILILVAKSFSIQGTSDLASVVLFTIALAMTVVPEALPMIMTVNLSNGALKLAQQKVIVKRLSAIEDLGRVNILCTDKTGTLTEDKLAITELFSDDEDLFKKLAIASIEDAKIKHGQLNSFDRAFSNFVPKDIQATVDNWRQYESLPFDPDARRRRMIVEDPSSKKFYLVVIGALEVILDLAKDANIKEYKKPIDQAGKEGKRQLAIAYKTIDYHPNFDILAAEKDLKYLGFVNMLDPLRPTSKKTIQQAEALGVHIKILTGDSVETATYIGQEVGLVQPGEKVYSGAELDKLTHNEFKKVVQASSVFARVTPEQKYRIIEELKQTGNVVGYQGDGINDAPSLKLADASIAVKNATDVAKDSADIILTESSLEVIINGIRYGRSIFVNINKYIKHAMVGNIGNFFSLAVFYVAFAAGLPMLPIQLLIANLLQDMPLMTVASDGVDDDEVEQPLVSSQVKSTVRTSLLLGIFTALFYLTYFVSVGTTANDATRTNLFIFFNLTQLLIIISVRVRGRFFWQGVRPSRLLLGMILLFVVGSIVMTYIPPIANLMGFVALPLPELLMIIGVSVLFILLLDVVKVGLNKFQTRKVQAAQR
ncbi:cation-transporting P-type ATPase [Candidatus Saccharibacteria bacterium]|nr:cation-transporting P-type ATPase [Candidatus Saccharibacteria bacterium]